MENEEIECRIVPGCYNDQSVYLITSEAATRGDAFSEVDLERLCVTREQCSLSIWCMRHTSQPR